MVIKKDENKRVTLYNFRLITLLNREFNILVKVLAKWLAPVIENLVWKVQICAIPTRSIRNNLHLR